jgi:hypothetical protein
MMMIRERDVEKNIYSIYKKIYWAKGLAKTKLIQA